MSETVFNANLTENEKVTIRQRVRSGCQLSAEGHLVVDGVQKDQYSRVRIFLRGKSYLVNPPSYKIGVGPRLSIGFTFGRMPRRLVVSKNFFRCSFRNFTYCNFWSARGSRKNL